MLVEELGRGPVTLGAEGIAQIKSTLEQATILNNGTFSEVGVFEIQRLDKERSFLWTPRTLEVSNTTFRVRLNDRAIETFRCDMPAVPSAVAHPADIRLVYPEASGLVQVTEQKIVLPTSLKPEVKRQLLEELKGQRFYGVIDPYYVGKELYQLVFATDSVLIDMRTRTLVDRGIFVPR